MSNVFIIFALFLLINIILSFQRVMKGPSTSDRMIAVYLLGTIGAGTVLLLGQAFSIDGLRDVAFLFALLGVMALISFVNRLWVDKESEDFQMHESTDIGEKQ